jgi:hypothetical protein
LGYPRSYARRTLAGKRAYQFAGAPWNNETPDPLRELLAQMPLKTTLKWSYLGENPDDDIRVFAAAQWKPDMVLLVYSGMKSTDVNVIGNCRSLDFHLPTPPDAGKYKVRYIFCDNAGDVNSYYGRGAKGVMFWSERQVETRGKSMPVCLETVAKATERYQTFCIDTLKVCDEIRSMYGRCGISFTSDANQSLAKIEQAGRQSSKKVLGLTQVLSDCTGTVAEAGGKIQAALKNTPVRKDSVLADAPQKELQLYLEKWLVSLKQIEQECSRLSYAAVPDYNEEYQEEIYTATLRGEAARLSDSLIQVELACNKIHNLWADAVTEEQSVRGKITRFARRNLGRVKDGRIAKEAVIAFDSLVLGTKMLYEAMDIRSDTDVQEWKERHQKDFDKISANMKKIQALNGWSLTDIKVDKPFEGIVNRVYKSRFGDSNKP